MATTQAEKERILAEARETVLGRLDAADNAGRTPLRGRTIFNDDSDGGAPASPPAPVAPAPADWSAWNEWCDSRVQAAIAAERTWMLDEMFPELMAIVANGLERAARELARERDRSEHAINKLRAELCKHVTDTLIRVENVLTAERIARGVERDAAAGEPPDKPLN